jgi:DNA-binding response OmpR family regulator
MVRLRRYIEDDPAEPQHLLTVRGVGYRFLANPEKK